MLLSSLLYLGMEGGILISRKDDKSSKWHQFTTESTATATYQQCCSKTLLQSIQRFEFWPDFVKILTLIIPAEALLSLFVPAKHSFNSFVQKFVFSSPLHWWLCLLTIKICVGLLFHKSIFSLWKREKNAKKKRLKSFAFCWRIYLTIIVNDLYLEIWNWIQDLNAD